MLAWKYSTGNLHIADATITVRIISSRNCRPYWRVNTHSCYEGLTWLLGPTAAWPGLKTVSGLSSFQRSWLTLLSRKCCTVWSHLALPKIRGKSGIIVQQEEIFTSPNLLQTYIYTDFSSLILRKKSITPVKTTSKMPPPGPSLRTFGKNPL